jgi:hypothetical protein
VPILRRFVREGATPLLVLGIIGCLYALAAVGLIPFPAELLNVLATRLAQGATMFVAGCSFLENTIGVNGYFPGAFVILFAMASTHGNILSALRVFGAIAGGAFVGQYLSYLAGRLAADHVSHERRHTADTLAALGVFWHPVLGSAYSFSVGRQSMSFGRFLVILAAAWIPWNIFWGVLMYNVGRVPISPGGFLGIFAVYLAAWLTLALVRAVRAGTADPGG